MRFSNFVRDTGGWQTDSTTTHFADKHLAVVTETVRSPNRPEPKPWTTVFRKAAVVVAPQTADGKFLLIKQERVSIRAAIWEMPAGQIDDNQEPDQNEIETVALREMHEETGYDLVSGGKLVSIGHFFCSPGFTDEHCHFFLAAPVEQAAKHHREEGESILECRAFTGRELRDLIAANEIRDANTLAMCARLAARGFLSLAPGT